MHGSAAYRFIFVRRMCVLQEDVLQYEKHRKNVHEDADLLFLRLAADQVDQDVGDDAHRDALGDTVHERHRDQAEEARDRLGVVREVDLQEGRDHEETDHDERRRRRERRDRKEDRGEEQGQREEDRGDHGGKAGAAALGDAGSALNESRRGGGSEQSAGGSADRIREERSGDLRKLAVLIKHVRLGGDADQGAQGIEHVDKEEGEDDDEEVEREQVGEIHLQEGRRKRGNREARGEVRQDRIHPDRGVRRVEAGDLADDAEAPGDEDAPEDAALDLADHEDAGDDDADERQKDRDALGAEGAVREGGLEAVQGDQRRAVDDDAGVLQADEGDVDADTGRDRVLDRHRDRIEDRLTDICHGEDDENETLAEDRGERRLPAVAHAEDDRVGKIGVEAHARCEDEGVVGEDCHHQGRQTGGQGCRGEDRAAVHAGCAQDVGVDGQDVGHGHESRHTGDDFGADVCFVFLQLEGAVQKTAV